MSVLIFALVYIVSYMIRFRVSKFFLIFLGSCDTSFKLEGNYGSPLLLIALIFYPLTSLFVSICYPFSRKVAPCFYSASHTPLSWEFSLSSFHITCPRNFSCFFSNCYSVVLIFLYLIFRFRLFLTNLLIWWPNSWKPVWIIKKNIYLHGSTISWEAAKKQNI